eukprot:scaffold68692_cov35-Prasinocladus_malaysianus.AAC.1
MTIVAILKSAATNATNEAVFAWSASFKSLPDSEIMVVIDCYHGINYPGGPLSAGSVQIVQTLTAVFDHSTAVSP